MKAKLSLTRNLVALHRGIHRKWMQKKYAAKSFLIQNTIAREKTWDGRKTRQTFEMHSILKSWSLKKSSKNNTNGYIEDKIEQNSVTLGWRLGKPLKGKYVKNQRGIGKL